jgi:DNA polymerase II small subunit/DNA polymerase delta subunit B
MSRRSAKYSTVKRNKQIAVPRMKYREKNAATGCRYIYIYIYRERERERERETFRSNRPQVDRRKRERQAAVAAGAKVKGREVSG